MQSRLPTVIGSSTAIGGLLPVLSLVNHLTGLIPALAARVAFEKYGGTLHRSAQVISAEDRPGLDALVVSTG